MGGFHDSGFTASPPSILSKVLQTTVLCPTFVANLLGNICVCLAVTRVNSLKRRPSSSILGSLALSDLSLLSFLLFRLIWLYDLEAASKVCEYFLVVLGALSYVSIIHICLLSCDRYVATVYPLRYTAIITRRRVRRTLVVSWCVPVLSILIVPLAYSNSGRASFRSSLIGCSESHSEPSLVHKIHLAFNTTLFVAIPFAVVVFVYGRIAKISWSHSNRVEPGEYLNPETAELRRKKKKEMKWMKTIVLVIGAFALCYLPAFIYVVLSAKFGASRIPMALRDTLVLLIGINSALNPMIYMLRSNEFKLAFRKFFKRATTGPQIENITYFPIGLSRMELPAYGPSNDCLTSFITVPNENSAAPEPKLKAPLTANAVGCLVVKTTPFSDVAPASGQDDRRPSFLAVPTQDETSPKMNKINFFRSESNISELIGPSCLELSKLGQSGYQPSFLTVPKENEAFPKTRSEASPTTSERSLTSIEMKIEDAKGEGEQPTHILSLE